MKRFAFTLLELVFVIIVIGILAVLAMPNFRGNPLQTAAEQVASHIRYTQHLAMIDDKFDPNDSLWFRENWQIEFKSATNVFYEIYSDIDHLGNSDSTTHKEEATDPLTGDSLDGNSDITDLKKRFGITSISFSSNCSGRNNNTGGNPTGGTGKELSFDSIGRPYFYITSATPIVSNIYAYLLTSDCNITLVHQTDGNATITIHPETGYVSVAYP
ncbi:MAG: prepilin-type N-terminal cleavage/methylation domain-containing protein [Sulfuricurvum sp.]|nr:prepilin-type N-terminal cleavage/methylation domain-containing protein [Sulfuricurvum sp.]MDP3023870.1 prepilin-type N-terminal cleavage/methylation domain-containing protein [Sulfuricurvum sp.]MDP3120554.1 prepilin-type N-terminal cleavage/methylation domain-containing protein [Sulfuricurvum sp.]